MAVEKDYFLQDLEELRELRNVALTFGERKEALRGIELILTEGEQQLLDAVWLDLRKSPTEVYITELDQALREVRLFRRRIQRWARPRRAGFSMMHFGAKGRVVAEPYGVVLIMSPWNYPIQLALMPAIAAIGAGNRVVLSLSPRAKATSEAIRRLAARYVSPGVLRVVPADAPDAMKVHTYQYDYVFYTGGPVFGKAVARSAANWLCPCTLELGGKSPAIVFGERNLDRAAKRIAWGKWLNAGQTCVAPDYVLAERGVARELAEKLAQRAEHCYGANALLSKDYPRMLSSQEAARMAALLEGVEVISGGEISASERYVAPTVVFNPAKAHPIMQDEIFGPLLPVLPVDTLQEAIDYINGHGRPLALYFFGQTSDFQRVLALTRSGGVCRGDTIMHITHAGLPFGGIGASGYGKYHGQSGFETFTHRRAVLDASRSPEIALLNASHKLLKEIERLLRVAK